MNSHPKAPEYKEIPKEITFIWVGGSIPEKYLKTIVELADAARRAPKDEQFTITVLTDDENHIDGPLSKLDGFKNHDASEYDVATLANINVQRYDSLFLKMKDDPFWEENDRGKRMRAALLRESCGFKNGAATSDLIRYIKLFFDGGYYFDTDTFLKKIKLKADQALHGIITNIKIAYRKEKGHIDITGSQGGNDMIGVCPRHPAIAKTIDLVLNNYDSLDEQKHYAHKGTDIHSPHAKLTGMDGKRTGPGRRPTTIWASGPTAFAQGLQAFCKECTDCSERAIQSVSIQSNTIAGVEVASRSDLTWVLQKAKNAVKGFFASPAHAPGLFGDKKPKKNKASRQLFFPEAGIELLSPKAVPTQEAGLTFTVTSPEQTPLPSPDITPRPGLHTMSTAQTLQFLTPTILSPVTSPRVLLPSDRPVISVPPSASARVIQITTLAFPEPSPEPSPYSSPLPTPRGAERQEEDNFNEHEIIAAALSPRTIMVS